MAKLMDEFIESKRHINGYGFFEGDRNVERYASMITKNQLRRFQRYGKIPGAFQAYMRQVRKFVHGKPLTFSHAIVEGNSVELRKDADYQLLEFLWAGRCSEPKHEGYVEAMIMHVLCHDRNCPPELFRPDGQRVWRRLEREASLRKSFRRR